jgi:hypothetical protein
MQPQTRLRLIRTVGLFLLLPLAFVLFVGANTVNRGPIFSGFLIALPLALYGVGFYLVLQKVADGSNPADSSS